MAESPRSAEGVAIEMVPAGAKAPATPGAALTVKEVAAPAEHHKAFWNWNWFTSWVVVWEVAMIILFGLCTEYAADIAPDVSPLASSNPAGAAQLNVRYSMWQDTHTMMAVGFGFLYTLLRRYAWSGVSWNYLITVLSIQWGLLCMGFWRNVYLRGKGVLSGDSFPAIHLEIDKLVEADYIAATCLISFGAVIGRVSAAQMAVMVFVEVIFAAANNFILFALDVTDPGGSMVIHCFGAAFGLALAWVYGDRAVKGHANGEAALGTSRHNGTFAMIGTAFLFLFWPSFNAALTRGATQHRVVINTLLAICASVASAFAVSKAIFQGKRFDMESIQNATLAGGVIIGACCDMLGNPWGALLAGTVAGAVSTWGFAFGAPFLKSRLGLTDTCGIAWLHCLPGIVGGFASAIAAAVVDPEHHWTNHQAMVEAFPGREYRTALQQGGAQAAMTVISVVFGAVTGAITGWIIKARAFEPMTESFYEDAGDWNVPYDEEESPEINRDVIEAMADQRAEILALVAAEVARATGKPSALPLPPRTTRSFAEATAAAHVGPSANERFKEGSVHGGSASRRPGEGSVRGGVHHRPAAASISAAGVEGSEAAPAAAAKAEAAAESPAAAPASASSADSS